jgi:hypothetical protein
MKTIPKSGSFIYFFKGFCLEPKQSTNAVALPPPSHVKIRKKAQAFSTTFELKFGSTFERLAPNLP